MITTRTHWQHTGSDTLAQFSLGTSKCRVQREQSFWLTLQASFNYDVLSLKIILTSSLKGYVLQYIIALEFPQETSLVLLIGQMTNRIHQSEWKIHFWHLIWKEMSVDIWLEEVR